MISTIRFDPSSLIPGASLTTDIVYSYVPNIYGTGANPLKLHLAIPRGAADRRLPVLLWIPGGAWALCEALATLPELSVFTRHGFIVAMAEYRISNTAPFPAQIIDVKTAIRFIRSHADWLHADPDRIALIGGSAGGHLVSLAGLAPDDPGFTGSEWTGVSDRVQAVVSLYGVMDIEELTMNQNPFSDDPDVTRLHLLMGGRADTKPELMRRASPIHYVTKDAPPFLLIHGTKDPVVPVEQSMRLYEKLQQAGIRSDLLLIEGAAHASEEFSQPEVYSRAADFLKEVLHL